LKIYNDILPRTSHVENEHNRPARFRDIGILSERGQTDRRTDGRTDGLTDGPTRPLHIVSSYSYAATNNALSSCEVNCVDPAKLLLHCLRASGATAAAAAHASRQLIKQHYLWRLDVIDCYIQVPVNEFLSVTRAMATGQRSTLVQVFSEFFPTGFISVFLILQVSSQIVHISAYKQLPYCCIVAIRCKPAVCYCATVRALFLEHLVKLFVSDAKCCLKVGKSYGTNINLVALCTSCSVLASQ